MTFCSSMLVVPEKVLSWKKRAEFHCYLTIMLVHLAKNELVKKRQKSSEELSQVKPHPARMAFIRSPSFPSGDSVPTVIRLQMAKDRFNWLIVWRTIARCWVHVLFLLPAKMPIVSGTSFPAPDNLGRI